MSGNRGNSTLKPCVLKGNDNLLLCHDLSHFADYEDQLFQIFLSVYEHGRINYHKIPVHMKHYPPDYGERSGFYHLICENYQHTGMEEDRSPNLRRCERLKWPQKIIEHCAGACPELLIWENERRGKVNILLFCPELDYIVVLGKRNNYLLLVTAYPVDYPNRRRNLLAEYNQYMQTTHSV